MELLPREGRDMAHSIRLRGRWEVEAVGRWVRGEGGEWSLEVEALPAGGKIEMPGSFGSVLGEDFLGRVRLRRRFHQPTGLGEGSVVWLVVEVVDGGTEVMLNGIELGVISSGQSNARFDVAAALRGQNVLEITVTSEQGRGGGLGLVRLEIE